MRHSQQHRSTNPGSTTCGSFAGLDLNGSTKGGSVPGLGVLAAAKCSSGSKTGRIDESVHLEVGGALSAVPGWKRVLDLSCILITLPVWLPLMIFISLWIRFTSSGPVFFRQTRIGLDARPFTILKFRSMRCGAETRTHEDHFKSLVESGLPMTKLDSIKDTRLIYGGRLLRATGMDELPQLINVLRGEMSLVGPRPCTIKELDWFTGRQKARFNVLPGMTGYWQVSGKNKTTFAQMVEMDIQYGHRMSVLFDVVIILGTVPALAMQAIETRWQLSSQPSEAAEPANRGTILNQIK